MKQFGISLRLTIVMLVICSVLYPLVVSVIALLAPGEGKGETLSVNGKVVGYANIGQSFTVDKYFWGRPSAVNYNAAGSAGSNKGPSNPDYLKLVQERIDSFLVRNPGIQKHQIPAEMVTASGSGLDPDISPQSAYIQIKRVAKARHISEEKLRALVKKHIKKPWLGPSTINVLTLNIDLDKL